MCSLPCHSSQSSDEPEAQLPQIFSLMHDSWTKNVGQSGKQLKTLKVEVKSHSDSYHVSNFPKHMSELQAMTHELIVETSYM